MQSVQIKIWHRAIYHGQMSMNSPVVHSTELNEYFLAFVFNKIENTDI